MGPFDLVTLLGVLRVTKTLPSFWLQFFPDEMTFDTEAIAMDKISEDYRRLAPFVAPNVQGRVQKQRGFSTVSYTPAYLKPKDIVDPNNNFFTRSAGESLATGSLTPEQRYNATVAKLLVEQKIKIDNRLEWMAAKAIQDGSVTCDGVDYPRVTINFNRDPSLTRVLTGTAQWNSTAAHPLNDIKAANRASNDLCGATNHEIIFGTDAFDSFVAWILANELKLIDTNYRGSQTNLALITNGFEGLEYAGRVQGLAGGAGFDVWIYSAKVTLEDGTQEALLAPNRVIGVSRMVNGVQAFGAIKDKKAGLRALRYFPKMWEVEDPSVEYLMTQSAPLIVPRVTNATWSLTVQ
jgi:hypothetical protein